jgi:hypothetical protein
MVNMGCAAVRGHRIPNPHQACLKLLERAFLLQLMPMAAEVQGGN